MLEVGSEAMILTHDAMAEGVHWLRSQDMADVAWKLVATNLSDLAAKGAEPLGVLLGYALGDSEEDARFVEGLREALDAFDVPLLGGDTIRSKGARTLGLTAIGRATHRPVPSRAGAQPGQALYVTGKLGAAMLGFEALRDKTGAQSLAFRRPSPRLAEGRALAPLVSAMMDVSDGLLLDASRLAEASGGTLAVETEAVPIAAPENRRGDALRWGDDYELLFTLPADTAPPCAATRIGEAISSKASSLLLDGAPPASDEPLGYRH